MDMMLLGETLISTTDVETTYVGFWMPASGNDGVGGAEVFAVSAANAFVVHLETKSSDENDTGATSIGNVTISSGSPSTYKFDVADAKDLVRYVVVNLTGGFAHLQFAQPLWTPN